MLGFPLLCFKGMRLLMFQLSGFYSMPAPAPKLSSAGRSQNCALQSIDHHKVTVPHHQETVPHHQQFCIRTLFSSFLF